MKTKIVRQGASWEFDAINYQLSTNAILIVIIVHEKLVQNGKSTASAVVFMQEYHTQLSE